jgi:hypothetical protein
VYGLAYCGGVVGAESVCSRLLDENSMIARTFLSVKRGHRGEGGHEGFERAAGDVRESRAGSDRGKEHRTEVTEVTEVTEGREATHVFKELPVT